MENEKSWIGWFIEDWQRYNHVLVLLYYLYPIFMIFTLIPLIPQYVGCKRFYHKNRQKTPYEIFDSIGDECRQPVKRLPLFRYL